MAVVVLLVGCLGGGDSGDLARLQRENAQLRRERDECRTAAAREAPGAANVPSPAPTTPAPAPPPPSAEPPPLVPIRTIVRRNSAGTSEVEIVVHNETRRTIDGFEGTVALFDNYNRPVTCRHAPGIHTQADLDRADGLVRRLCNTGILTARVTSDESIRGRAERRVGVWSLFDFDGSTKGIATITSVHFTDNSVWAGSVTQEEDPREPTR